MSANAGTAETTDRSRPPERGSHHDHRHGEDADRDPHPHGDATRHATSHEQHRRRDQLREREVPLTHEADPDRRRVAEHRVPFEVRASHEIDTCSTTMLASPTSNARWRPRRRPTRKNAAASTNVTPTTKGKVRGAAVAAEVERPAGRWHRGAQRARVRRTTPVVACAATTAPPRPAQWRGGTRARRRRSSRCPPGCRGTARRCWRRPSTARGS